MRCVAHHKNLSWGGGVGVSVFPLGQPFCKRLYLIWCIIGQLSISVDWHGVELTIETGLRRRGSSLVSCNTKT
jgi:hypothetical protein